jgi:tRNA-(ms[2]io[6]A)-hydroxylase
MMFRLSLKTDPRWAKLAEEHPSEILTDHAWCEQKAASTAISLIIQYSDYPELVAKMSELAKEEMEHFSRVHEFIRKRRYKLGRERKDEYVNRLMMLVRKGEGRLAQLLDRLLFAAIIEARSCERFRLLSETIQDAELSAFYRELMESEAGHYTLFISLARDIAGREQADARWQQFLAAEDEIIRDFGDNVSIHG